MPPTDLLDLLAALIVGRLWWYYPIVSVRLKKGSS